MSAAVTLPVPPELAEAVSDKERVVLTRDGRPVAAVVPIEDFEALEAAEDEQDAADARGRLAAWEAAGRPAGTTLEELASRWGIDLHAPE
jgi:prevent-host-death family protein